MKLVINNDVAMQKGVSIKDAMDNLSIVIGSTWEQGFIRFNQFYKVFVQALPQFRRYPEDFENIFVKNDKGDMVPYSSFMTLKKQQGLNEINRYNLYPSAPIQLSPAPGYSSGQAIAAIKEVAAETLPRGYGLGWEALAYDEAGKGNEAIYIFLIVVVFVYLVLVGQYESFILPLAVIMSLPVGIFGSFFFLQAMGLANDVYCQIGLVMLVGLLGKNAILIVEFAVQRHHEGASLKEAAIEGGKLRFRPILMTSFAFIAGLIPLVRATGPGAIGNRTIGSTAVGGMLLGTVIGVLVIPGLYYLFGRLDGDRKLLQDETHRPLSESVEHHGDHTTEPNTAEPNTTHRSTLLRQRSFTASFWRPTRRCNTPGSPLACSVGSPARLVSASCWTSTAQTDKIVAFLRDVHAPARRPIIAVCDRLPAHRAAVRRLHEEGAMRLDLEWLPRVRVRLGTRWKTFGTNRIQLTWSTSFPQDFTRHGAARVENPRADSMPAAVQCRVLKSHLPESRLLAAALRELRTSRVLACNESSQFSTVFRLSRR